MALLLHQRRGDIARGGDDGVARDLDGGPVLAGADDGAVPDLAERGLEVDGDLFPREPLAQVRAVGQADALLRDQIVLHLDDGDVLALQGQLIRDLAAGQAAANDRDCLAHRRAQQVFAGLEHLLVAGDLLEHARRGAGGNDDGVGAEGLDLLDLGMQPDLDAELFHLAAVPAKKVAELSLVALGGGGDERAAELAGLLIEDGLVAAERQHAGGLHAADAAADDVDGLRLVGLFDVVLVPLHHLGVDRAAGQMQRVAQVLIVRHALVVAHVEAAVVAEDAGADVVFAVLDDLGEPFRVREEIAREARAVEPAFGDGLCRGLERHAARADDGDIDEVLDVLDLGEVAVFGHIDRRVRPVPGVIGAVVAVEHVVARVLQEFRRDLGLCHVTPGLDVVLAGQRALAEALGLGDDGIAQRHREVRAAGGLDGLDDLGGEAVAVFQTPAVFVRALVDVVERELVKKIPFVDRVDLDAVDARVLQELGALGKRVDEFLDLRLRHLARRDLVRPAVGRRAGRGRDLIEIHERLGDGAQRLVRVELFHHLRDGEAPAEARRQLDEQLRARLVELRHPFGQILVHLLVLVQPLAVHRVIDRLTAGQDETGVVLCRLENEARAVLVKMVDLHPAEQVGAAHAGEHDAVFDLHLADLPRREQRLVAFLQNDSPLFRFCMRGSGSPLLVGIRAAHIFLLPV